MTATDAPSDALVLFGATGDLAKKKIFPAIYNMTKTDHDHVPVVGFASSEWDDDRLRQHAREAIEAKGDGRRGGVGGRRQADLLRARRLPRSRRRSRALADRLRDARRASGRSSTWPSRRSSSTT